MFAVVGLVVPALVGCKPPPAPPSVVTIRVEDEARAPVAGADIVAQSDVVAGTDVEGRAEVMVSGREGTTFQVEIRCPKLYRSPTEPLAIRRFVTGDASSPEYLAKCSRLRHTLVVAIHADGGANLPVLHLGKEVARTDEVGSASVRIEGEVRERVDLQLDTSDPKYAKLHPQNPVSSFEISNRDEIQRFDVKFTRDAKPVAKVQRRAAPKAF
jgi:hypothetical protein